jgi:hypothetical protein
MPPEKPVTLGGIPVVGSPHVPTHTAYGLDLSKMEVIVEPSVADEVKEKLRDKSRVYPPRTCKRCGIPLTGACQVAGWGRKPVECTPCEIGTPMTLRDANFRLEYVFAAPLTQAQYDEWQANLKAPVKKKHDLDLKKQALGYLQWDDSLVCKKCGIPLNPPPGNKGSGKCFRCCEESPRAFSFSEVKARVKEQFGLEITQRHYDKWLKLNS